MRVAILDDDPKDAGILSDYLQRYRQETQAELSMRSFHAALDFLEEYDGGYDVVFLDIEMPGMDGMETAKELRARDESVGIVFVTNMAQYAIRGYEVNASDFVVKPIGYYNFVQKLEKAQRFAQRRRPSELLLSNGDELVRVPTSEIYCLERDKNYVLLHTARGDFRERGSVQQM